MKRYRCKTKISSDIIDGLSIGEKVKRSNTETDGKSVWLYGNEIYNEKKGINFCGYPTITTAERLNPILYYIFRVVNHRFSVANHSVYLTTDDNYKIRVQLKSNGWISKEDIERATLKLQKMQNIENI